MTYETHAAPPPCNGATTIADLLRQLEPHRDGTLHQRWYRHGNVETLVLVAVGSDARAIADWLDVEEE